MMGSFQGGVCVDKVCTGPLLNLSPLDGYSCTQGSSKWWFIKANETSHLIIFQLPAPGAASHPTVPAAVPAASVVPTQPSSVLSPEDSEKAQKYCRFAASALQYEDVKTAIDNLHKALALLEK